MPEPGDDRVLVKICGLTTPADAETAAGAGADWVGLNFHPPSPRFVADEAARAIVRALPASCTPVGLFVDRSAADVAATADRLGLTVVQLHGGEPPETLAALGGLRVVKAFRLRDRAAIDAMIAYLDRCATLGRPPDAVLIDAYAPGLPGGTGLEIGDDLLAMLPALPRLILAGGLTPENVAERVRRVHPWMVDVAGGVESAPGCKDPAKVTRFVAAARGG